MTETEAGRNAGSHAAGSRGGKPAHAADEPARRMNGSATAVADPGALDSTTIIPRIPAEGDAPMPVATPVPAPRPGRAAANPTAAAAVRPVAEPATGDRPARLRGTTAIAGDVVEKVAAFAAEQVDGVFDLGGDVARAISTVREAIDIGEGTSRRGVHVELAGAQARITLTLVVQFGHPAMQVAGQVRENVIAAVETMMELDVSECNVIIDDIHVED
ncbi:MAG TPA: Asp23/Gls24 family envelope stress response protein [Actinocatenispora sp.]